MDGCSKNSNNLFNKTSRDASGWMNKREKLVIVAK